MDSSKQVKLAGSQGFSGEVISSDVNQRVTVDRSTWGRTATVVVYDCEEGTVAGIDSGRRKNIDGRVAGNVTAKRGADQAIVADKEVRGVLGAEIACSETNRGIYADVAAPVIDRGINGGAGGNVGRTYLDHGVPANHSAIIVVDLG